MFTRRPFVLLWVLAPVLLVLPACIAPANPFTHVLSFQGRLSASDGKPLPDGPYIVRFTLYSAPVGGIGFWGEAQGVTQVGGTFVAYLGTVTPFPTDLFSAGNLWLGIKVGAEPEMPARVQLTPSPWAIYAADSTHAKLADQATNAAQADSALLAKNAENADNAHKVDMFHAGSTAAANRLLTLDGTAKWPLTTIPQGTGSGLDADNVDTFHASATAAANRLLTLDGSAKWPLSTIPQGTGSGLDADKLDGQHAGNDSGNVAISNGAVCTNLNADRVDGQHGSYYQDAGNLTIGTLPDARLSTNVALLNTVQTFTSDKFFSADVGIGTVFPIGRLDVRSSTSGTAVVYALNTALDDEGCAVVGVHAVSDGHGVGVKGVGGLKGVEGAVTAGGSGPYIYYGVYGTAGGDGGGKIAVYGYASGEGNNTGIYGRAVGGTTNTAGIFSGNVNVIGTLSKSAGSFKIDHPLDPANKYLSHSFVESPDMMNIYNGNVVTDDRGYATITMPDWFEALNRDFRYQLTVIDNSDDFVMAKVTQEIEDGSFVIRTSAPNVKVSWMVTGIRQDVYANLHRIPLEEEKAGSDRGRYLHPDAYGRPMDEGIGVLKQTEIRIR